MFTEVERQGVQGGKSVYRGRPARCAGWYRVFTEVERQGVQGGIECL